MTAIYFIIGVLIGAGVIAGIYFGIRYFRTKRLMRSLELVLMLVKIAKEEKTGTQGAQQEKDFKVEISRFEQLIANLATMKRPFVFEVAVPHIGEEIHFYIAVPKKMSEVTKKQIQGLWAGASVERMADDYNIFNPSGATAGAYLLQKEDFALPIRTYQELEADSFASVLGALSKVNEVGEGAALQVVAIPAHTSTKRRIETYIESLKKGKSVRDVLHNFPVKFSDVKRAFNPEIEERERQEHVIDEEGVKILTSKIMKPLFNVNVRIIASASSPFQANDLVDAMTAGFQQFASPSRNEFKVVKPKNANTLASQYIFRAFDASKAMILTSEEIASFAHFPTSGTETPRVKWLKSKEAAPPSNLPTQGTLIGESSFRGEKKSVYVTDDDRRRHIYIIGQTGTGKSTLLQNMVMEDIKKGKGIALIDPHGDLVENALTHIPKERVDDLILFDPSDLVRPLGLNMIDFNPNRPEEKTFIVNEMQSIFNKLFSQETMGPMFEQYMRNALLLLMEDAKNEPATLIEVPRIFTDVDFRRRKLERISNPIVIDFWEKEAIKAGGEASLANMTPYITSKFNNFISNDYMRPIIGQVKSAFNFRQAMDEGKILLINLSKGRIGDINAGLLGMVFTGKILMAALSRVDITDGSKRRDFNLYIDEFQNFTTDSIATILSEARKYGLSMSIAHQFIAQLEENIRDAVFGNVGSQIAFRVGVQDAEFLAKQFEPNFDQNDLISIDNFNAHVKILINGETSKPFNLKIGGQSLVKGDVGLAEKMKEYSRAKYGMDRDEIEAGIYKRLRE